MKRFILLASILSTSAVAQEPVTNTAAPIVAVDPISPAEAQKRFVAQIKADIKRAEVEIEAPHKNVDPEGKTNTYLAEYDGKLEYDIKKTDSIVSPYTGIAVWDVKWSLNGRDTGIRMSFVGTYSYQDGAWVFKGLKRRAYNEDGSPHDMPADEYVEAFQ